MKDETHLLTVKSYCIGLFQGGLADSSLKEQLYSKVLSY